MSPPVWVAWIEIPYVTRFYKWEESPPVWVAWIEISVAILIRSPKMVATRMGGVD